MSENKENMRGVAAISIGHFVHDIFTAFFAPLLPVLKERLGMSYAEAGFFAALQQAPALLNPFLGAMAERTSLRWLMVSAPIISALAMSSLIVAPNKLILGGLLLVAGVGTSLWHVLAPVMLANVAGKRRGFGMSLFMVAGEGARSVGPLLALWGLGLFNGWGIFFLLPLAFVTSFVLWRVTRGLEKSYKKKQSRTVGALEKSRLIRLFSGAALVLGARAFMVGALSTYLPAFVVEGGGTLWFGGIALAILQAAGAFGAFFSGGLSDRLGRRYVLIIVSSLAPFAMFLVALSPADFLPAALVVMGILAFATNPVLLAFVQDEAHTNPAFANGLYMSLAFVTRALVLVGVGFIADRVGLKDAFFYGAIIGFIAIPGALLLPAEPKPTA